METPDSPRLELAYYQNGRAEIGRSCIRRAHRSGPPG